MACKKYKKMEMKSTQDNKSYIDNEDKESREIAREFQKKTKISKKF